MSIRINIDMRKDSMTKPWAYEEYTFKWVKINELSKPPPKLLSFCLLIASDKIFSNLQRKSIYLNGTYNSFAIFNT